METGDLKRILNGHSRGIACLHLEGDFLVSGSSGELTFTFLFKFLMADNTIRIWNPHTGNMIASFEAHTGLVRTLQFNDTKLVSGSYDAQIKVWDRNSQALLLHVQRPQLSKIFKLQFDNTKIVSCSADEVGVSFLKIASFIL